MFDDQGIDSAFCDILELSVDCRYRDCEHRSEPGCAVRAAVASGTLAPERVDHYLKLGAEAHAYEIRRDERQRREAERVWGKEIARLGKAHRRWKEGR